MLDADFEVSEQCCDIMKKKPAKKYEKLTGRKPILGNMAVESRVRMQAWTRTGCNAYESASPKSTPMAFWTENDVLQYLKEYDVPYCELYGDIIETNETVETLGGDVSKFENTGLNRTGCIFCGFGAHLEKSPNRFEKLKSTHRKQYNYCMGGGHYVDGVWKPNKDGLGMSHVLDFIGVEYGKEERTDED